MPASMPSKNSSDRKLKDEAKQTKSKYKTYNVEGDHQSKALFDQFIEI